jgi:hypothetical protein
MDTDVSLLSFGPEGHRNLFDRDSHICFFKRLSHANVRVIPRIESLRERLHKSVVI